MNLLRKIWIKLRSLWQRPSVKQEIDEELRFHLEQRTAENIAAGMAPEEAAREARKRFGNWQSVRVECRERRGASFGEATWQAVRFGLRMLRKNPGFTTIAVLTLALGIGVNTSMFTGLHSLLLPKLPYPEPDRLVRVFRTSAHSQRGPLSQAGTVHAMVAQTHSQFAVGGWRLSAFAGLGLLLAALGIYGVMAGFVAQRSNEIGVRMALGAQVHDVLKLVLGRGLKLTMLGTALGLAGAVGMTRTLRAIAPGLESDSPLVVALVAALLVAVALVACWLPARRAAKVDPMVALRTE